MSGAPQGRPEYKAIGHALNVRMLGTSLDRVVPHGWIYEWMGAEVEPNKEWLCKHHCGLQRLKKKKNGSTTGRAVVGQLAGPGVRRGGELFQTIWPDDLTGCGRPVDRARGETRY